MKRSFLFLLALAACGPDRFMSVGDSGKSPDGSSSLDAQDGEITSDGGGLDRVVPPGDSSTDAGLCPDPNDVEHDGRCYYLDGSKGTCDQGYVLSSNAKLAILLAAKPSAWKGKGFKHTQGTNLCVLTKDNVQNYGMLSNMAPFDGGQPVSGGSGCWMISPPNMFQGQITLCESQ